MEVNLPFLLCFTLYLRAIFLVQVDPGGLIFGEAIQRRVFCVTGLGGLYLEGLIHGGAYFRNFTVFSLCIALALRKANFVSQNIGLSPLP